MKYGKMFLTAILLSAVSSQAFAFDVSDMTKYENYLGNDVLPE